MESFINLLKSKSNNNRKVKNEMFARTMHQHVIQILSYITPRTYVC